MTIKLASLKANLDREAKGDWEEHPDFPGVKWHVKSILTPSYVVARDLLLQKLSRQSKGGTISQEKRSLEFGKLFCKHLLNDWKGLDVEYSPEKALEVLTDPAYRAVLGAVEWCAGKIADIDVQFIEDEEKNSVAPSSAE